MRNFTNSNQSGGEHPAAGSQQPTSVSFSQTVSEMWRTRPYRLPKKDGSRAWISGVCEGIAVRYQVDPLLIRILFVALALAGGFGVALYAAAVLALPRRGVEQPAVERLLNWKIPEDSAPGGKERQATLKAERRTAVCATIVLALCFMVSATILQVGSLLLLLVCAAGVWFLHKRMPIPPQVMENFKYPAGFEATVAGAPGGPASTDVAGPVTPPSWNSLGPTAFAWAEHEGAEDPAGDTAHQASEPSDGDQPRA
ncbi:PspC domain-containing protein [Corynebacterium urealyticum]|nr:PspC domain-containing protein [Corynebacterium urealyticum]QQC42408.1 PspC domain-containing protein [Corynebacterium urealyticum]SNV93075.1 hypothetical membrane protein [Corynebacterium urealyticum]